MKKTSVILKSDKFNAQRGQVSLGLQTARFKLENTYCRFHLVADNLPFYKSYYKTF